MTPESPSDSTAMVRPTRETTSRSRSSLPFSSTYKTWTVFIGLVAFLALSEMAQMSQFLQSVVNFAMNSDVRPMSQFGNSSSLSPLQNSINTDVDIVSLTVKADFYVLFNNSAISSWVKFIQNVKSITFIGRPQDEILFRENMAIHYPEFPTDQTIPSNQSLNTNHALPTVYFVNETHWNEKYRKKYTDKRQRACPYIKVCQQLIKLHVFDLVTDLGKNYIGDNILIVDSGEMNIYY